jgi:hypothetical protein
VAGKGHSCDSQASTDALQSMYIEGDEAEIAGPAAALEQGMNMTWPWFIAGWRNYRAGRWPVQAKVTANGVHAGAA